MTIEYRIKPVVRYFVTRHVSDGVVSGVQNCGSEYSSGETAYEVAYALARADVERLSLPIDSMEVIFPTQPIQYTLETNGKYGVDQLVFHSRAPSHEN